LCVLLAAVRGFVAMDIMTHSGTKTRERIHQDASVQTCVVQKVYEWVHSVYDSSSRVLPRALVPVHSPTPLLLNTHTFGRPAGTSPVRWLELVVSRVKPVGSGGQRI
jgi:hypothetical protein